MLKRLFVVSIAILGIILLAAGLSFFSRLRPVSEAAAPGYLRIWKGDTLGQALDRAEASGFIRSAQTARLYTRIFRRDATVRAGTFELSPSMTSQQVLQALLDGEPVRQMVRIREGRWLEEVADILEDHLVAPRQEVLELVQEPDRFEQALGFRVAAADLEGYLLPDTYDLPPLLGAEEAIERMLRAFVAKVYEPLGRPGAERIHELVIIGSMIEMEAGVDEEREKIAGVIENRRRINMPLQIDATVIYGLRERRRLLYGDYRLDHPYNTYRINGLPPGPICSPRALSVLAAANPQQHDYLYYVAMPDLTHLFGRTYAEHRQNIITSRAAFARRDSSTPTP